MYKVYSGGTNPEDMAVTELKCDIVIVDDKDRIVEFFLT